VAPAIKKAPIAQIAAGISPKGDDACVLRLFAAGTANSRRYQ